MEQEIKNLKGYQLKQDLEYKALMKELDQAKKISNERTNQMQYMKDYLQQYGKFFVQQLQSLIVAYNNMKEEINKELLGFNDKDFVEKQEDRFTNLDDILEQFEHIKVSS